MEKKIKSDFLQALNQKGIPAKTSNFKSDLVLVKGDVSGIQDFIFNTKSKGAAKTLKGKSFFVKILTELIINRFKSIFEDIDVIIKSGGNFYFTTSVKNISKIDEIKNQINSELISESLFVSIVSQNITLNDLKNTKGVWKEINKKSGYDKLNKYSQSPEVWQPYSHKPESGKWKDLGNALIKAKSLLYYDAPKGFKVEEKGVQLINAGVTFDKKTDAGFVLLAEDINNYVPLKNTDEICEFEELADLAFERTGTKKIASLKLDVDNLGEIFKKLCSIEEIQAVSKAIDYFFNNRLIQIMAEQFSHVESTSHIFKDNIYTVFAGGDDCFFIGAWDAIFAFTLKLQEQFNLFFSPEISKMSFCASINVIGPSHPLKRIAEEAEEALTDAKNFNVGEKNSVSVFGQVLRWREFEQVVELKDSLIELIVTRNESRAILERIKRSAKGYDKLQKGIIKNNEIPFPKIANLGYYLIRSVNNEESRKFADDKILKVYETNLISAISGNYTNALLFPIAARYVELLTKKRQ